MNKVTNILQKDPTKVSIRILEKVSTEVSNVITTNISDITNEMKTSFTGQTGLIDKINNIHENTRNFLTTKSKNATFIENIESYKTKIEGATRNKQKYIDSYVSILRDLYVNVFSFLRKQYNLHKKYIPASTTASTTASTPGSAKTPVSVSQEGTMLANNFLKTLTKGILTKSKDKYNSFKDKNSSDMKENGELYKTERELLIKIAKEGKVPSYLDTALFDTFSNQLDYIYEHSDKITPAKYKEELDNVLKPNKGKIQIINNAFVTEDKGKGRIIHELKKNSDIYSTLCPITSILDAQGTFGSCSSGTITNGLNKDQDITLQSEEETFEFNLKINYNNTGKTTVNYYTMYDGFGVYECNIHAKIGKGKSNMEEKNVLSANNTFKLLLNYIEETFQKDGVADWDVFLNDGKLSKLIQIASKKMIGDFGQELTAVVKGGGYTNDDTRDSMQNILLTNGDQPSTVRAAFILLNAYDNVEDSNSVLYLSTSKGFLYKINESQTGGSANKGGRKTKTLKKQKTKTLKRKKTLKKKKSLKKKKAQSKHH